MNVSENVHQDIQDFIEMAGIYYQANPNDVKPPRNFQMLTDYLKLFYTRG
jgi:hypothetical protein